MGPQVPVAVVLLLACMLVGWLAVRGGQGGPRLLAVLLVAVTALQAVRILAGH